MSDETPFDPAELPPLPPKWSAPLAEPHPYQGAALESAPTDLWELAASGRLETVEVRPGDDLVFTVTPGKVISSAQAEAIGDAIKRAYPGHRVLRGASQETTGQRPADDLKAAEDRAVRHYRRMLVDQIKRLADSQLPGETGSRVQNELDTLADVVDPDTDRASLWPDPCRTCGHPLAFDVSICPHCGVSR